MDQYTTSFIEAAKNDQPVYITDVRRKYLQLNPEESFAAPLILTKVDGSEKVFELRFPKFSSYPPEGRQFVKEFFLAEAYNILSSLGGNGIRMVNPDNADETGFLADAFREGFCTDISRHERKAYGRSLNVIERMLHAINKDHPEKPGKFSFAVIGEMPAAIEASPMSGDGAVEIFRGAAQDLAGKAILGVDIGGTDVKLALAVDGKLVSFKEYDWFPASFTNIHQLIDPVVELVQAMAKEAAGRTGEADFKFDAIGMCFPDVVVNNKIVGGEVFKTRGIRDALGSDYDNEFAILTDLDVILKKYVKENGIVGIVNDGPMAAFTAGVETAVRSPEAVKDGVFAYTLGTELGTGYVTGDGKIPDIPLEVYNFIIDLGSWAERAYEPDDLRSINNFNTRLPGTLQKFACQSGVFRLALKYLKNKRPELMEEMKEKGFVAPKDHAGVPGLYVPTTPKDMRKPFLEYVMGLVDSDGDPELLRIFEEIGVALAVTGEEIDWILEPTTAKRMLFGRLVKRASCFRLMFEGARGRYPGIDFAVADDGIAETPLMKALSESEFTVAQFAQAVGAVHYGNYLLGATRLNS